MELLFTDMEKTMLKAEMSMFIVGHFKFKSRISKWRCQLGNAMHEPGVQRKSRLEI